jgi:Raf kinase inhibitor-like YbhB/YbcL family protein
MAQHSSSEPITIQRVSPREAGRLALRSLALTSEAIGADGSGAPVADSAGRIGEAYAADHDDISPPLMWTEMPEAETFCLIVEDPDAPTERPFLHWAVWNIPGAAKGLPANLPKTAMPEGLRGLEGLVQGSNDRGRFGYMGPKPPPGDGPHRYHFQLFALDIRLDLPPDAPLEALVQVLKAHAIASSELVGLYETAADQPEAVADALDGEPRSFTSAEVNAGRAGLDRDDVDRHAPHDPEGVARPDRSL